MISFPYTSNKTLSGSKLTFDRAIDSSIKRKYNLMRYKPGVAVDLGGGFQVVAGSGMQVKVHCADAWGMVGGDFFYEPAEYRQLTVQAADQTYDRIDRVIVRNDISEAARKADLEVLKGTPAPVPVPPALTNIVERQEICLAELFIRKGIATISQDRITDTRLDPSVCGALGNAFGDIDTSQFFAQLQQLAEDLKKEIEKIQLGSESMLKSVYDPDGDGIVKSADNGIFFFNAALAGGVLKLTGPTVASSIKFTAPADYTAGTQIQVNGMVMAAQTASGEPLWSGFFKSGAVVACYKSGSTLTFNSGGLSSADRKTAEDFLPETKALLGGSLNGTVPVLYSKRWVPSTSDQEIPAGRYTGDSQIIAGDRNLVPGNIRKGASLFGITGTYETLTGPGACAFNTLMLKWGQARFAGVNPSFFKVSGTTLTALRPMQIQLKTTAWAYYDWDQSTVVKAKFLVDGVPKAECVLSLTPQTQDDQTASDTAYVQAGSVITLDTSVTQAYKTYGGMIGEIIVL